jgi:hypothetical protein
MPYSILPPTATSRPAWYPEDTLDDVCPGLLGLTRRFAHSRFPDDPRAFLDDHQLAGRDCIKFFDSAVRPANRQAAVSIDLGRSGDGDR